MLRYVNRQAVTRIMEVYSALNFRVTQQSSGLLHTEVEGTKVLSTSRTTCPMTQHRIPLDWNFQPCSKNLKPHTQNLTSLY